MVDLVTALMEFVCRHFVQVPGSIRGEEFSSEPVGQLCGMILNETNETECNHGRPPALLFLSYVCWQGGGKVTFSRKSVHAKTPVALKTRYLVASFRIFARTLCVHTRYTHYLYIYL